MFGFGKDKKEASVTETREKGGLLARLRQGLARTGKLLNTDLRELVSLSKKIDDELLEELETRLLTADLGVEATQTIIGDLTKRVARNQLADSDALFGALREDMAALLAPSSKPLTIPDDIRPFVILMVGINGAGKTTTIGKLAKRLQSEGKWETPLGKVEIDSELAERLLKNSKYLQKDESAHEQEKREGLSHS